MKKKMIFAAAMFAALCFNSCDKRSPLQEVREMYYY